MSTCTHSTFKIRPMLAQGLRLRPPLQKHPTLYRNIHIHPIGYKISRFFSFQSEVDSG